jgi:sigma-E factor negative regulatory protein RseB
LYTKYVVLGLVVIVFNWSLVFAASPYSGSVDHQALNRLVQIQSAAKTLDYAGTFVYQQGGQIRTSNMAHIVRDGLEQEKVVILDGVKREYIRRNDEVTRYMPETKTLLVEKRVTRDIFPAILVANTDDLAQYYRVILQGTERVAGKKCQIILLSPIDKLRYGYRLCAEYETHLLLRAQTQDANNSVIEQMLFTELRIGRIDSDSVKPGFPDTHDWQVKYADVIEKVSLPRWEVTPPPGFKQIQAVRHILTGRQRSASASDRKADSARREVSQLVYSDGLAAISVFIEPYTSGKIERIMHQGAMNIIGRRHGQYWVTVMGEAPDLAVRQVINSITLIN